MKLAYIGIDLFFDALVALDKLSCEIAEIFTCKTDNKTEFNIKIRDFAEQRGIPCSLQRITAEDIARLKRSGCDFGVCAGYYYKIPADTGFPIVNIHPSLLPLGRGPWPMPLSILRGDKKSGVTIHKIAKGFDTGDILLQREFDIAENETLVSFMEKACALIPPMLGELTENFGELWNNARPQQGEGYDQMPSREQMTVNSRMTAADADKILRAFLGYECFYEDKFEIIGGRAFKGEPPKDSLPLSDGYVKYEKKERI